MYKLSENGVIRIADGASIPADPGNRDWREYEEWLSTGNVPEPADPSPKNDIGLAKNRAIGEVKGAAFERILDVSITTLRTAFSDAKTALKAAGDVASVEAARDAAIAALDAL